MHDLAPLRSFLLAQPGAVEDYPFGPSPLVLKVGGKIFALVSHDASPPEISLKCDPIDTQLLRDRYQAVRPGYHLNKRHWNTVTLDGSIPEPELHLMVTQSYKLVVAGLSRAERKRLEEPQ